MASTLHPPQPPPSASSLHPSTHFTLSPLVDPLPFHLHPLHAQHLSPLPPPLWGRPSTHRSRQARVTHPPREQTAAAAAAIIPVSTRPSLKPRKQTSRDTCAAGAPPPPFLFEVSFVRKIQNSDAACGWRMVSERAQTRLD